MVPYTGVPKSSMDEQKRESRSAVVIQTDRLVVSDPNRIDG